MLNSVIMMGRLTDDPELRHTASDVPVTSFTIAVERSFVKQGAERQTDFFDVVAWSKLADSQPVHCPDWLTTSPYFAIIG